MAPQLAQDGDVVVDVGCGYLIGTKELLKHHGTVYAVDTEIQADRVASRLDEISTSPRFGGFLTLDQLEASDISLDGAYLVNVLHTIPTVDRRLDILAAVRSRVKDGGFLLIDVPSYEYYYSQRMTKQNALEDGHYFKNGPGYTFYRFCKADELDSWANKAGFVFEGRAVVNHHLVRLYSAEI